MSPRLLAGALIAVAVLLVAGCGDGEDNAAAAWADTVCSSVDEWRTDVESNIEELRENPSSISADSLRAAADESLESTQSLVDELRELGAPDTESGEQAREELANLLEALEERIERVREAVEAADEGVAEIVTVIASLANEVQGAANDARETLTELREIDPGGDLEQAFSDEESCEALQD